MKKQATKKAVKNKQQSIGDIHEIGAKSKDINVVKRQLKKLAIMNVNLKYENEKLIVYLKNYISENKKIIGFFEETKKNITKTIPSIKKLVNEWELYIKQNTTKNK